MFKSRFSRTILMIGVPVVIFLLVLAFLTSARDTEQVLVVNRPLQPGSRLDDSGVVLRELPRAAILAGAFRDPAQVVAQTVTVGRLPGDTAVSFRTDTPNEPRVGKTLGSASMTDQALVGTRDLSLD